MSKWLRPVPGAPVAQMCGVGWRLGFASAICIAETASDACDVRASPAALPIAGNALGALVMVRTLDGLARAEDVLGESARVLVPGGQLLIVGLNPWSLCAFRARHLGLSGRLGLHAPGRLYAGLGRAGLTVEGVHTCFYRPPIGMPWIFGAAGVLERIGPRLLPRSGGVYVLTARKRQPGVCLLPIRSRSARLRYARPAALSARVNVDALAA